MSAGETARRADDMVQKAEQAVADLSQEYDDGLLQLVENLTLAMKNNERESAAQQAYHLCGSAGSMGWPLLSEISRWLSQVLEVDKGSCLTPITKNQISGIKLIVRKEWKGEHPSGQKLIRSTYQMLEAKGYHPF